MLRSNTAATYNLGLFAYGQSKTGIRGSGRAVIVTGQQHEDVRWTKILTLGIRGIPKFPADKGSRPLLVSKMAQRGELCNSTTRHLT